VTGCEQRTAADGTPAETQHAFLKLTGCPE
jgi:hypothetical protein